MKPRIAKDESLGDRYLTIWIPHKIEFQSFSNRDVVLCLFSNSYSYELLEVILHPFCAALSAAFEKMLVDCAPVPGRFVRHGHGVDRSSDGSC